MHLLIGVVNQTYDTYENATYILQKLTKLIWHVGNMSWSNDIGLLEFSKYVLKDEKYILKIVKKMTRRLI